MSNLHNVSDLIFTTLKGITPKYVDDSSIIVLNQKCIRDNRVNYSFSRHHNPSKTFPDSKVVQVGDILINSTGQGTAGRCAFVKELPKDYTVVVDSHILIVRVNCFYTAGCLAYSLFSIEPILQTFMDGSTGQGEFDKQRLFNVITALPDLKKRSTTYDFLNKIDKKIELNNRICAELEAMIKTQFEYWFIQFDFPDTNGLPYKLSGGKMVYNELLKRKIPEEWKASNILQVAQLLGGGTPTKAEPKYWEGNIPFFTPTDSSASFFSLSTENYITQNGLENSSTKLFEPNTIFITARGSVGRLALNAVPMAMNQSCYALKAKEGVSHTYLFFLTKELIHHLKVKATGSVFNSIVSNDIEWTNLAIPSDNGLIQEFAKVAEPIFKKIKLCAEENAKLESLRNWLLPMLMNGQVTVK